MAALIQDEKWLVLLVEIFFWLSSGTSSATYRWAFNLYSCCHREDYETLLNGFAQWFNSYIDLHLPSPWYSDKKDQFGPPSLLEKLSLSNLDPILWKYFCLNLLYTEILAFLLVKMVAWLEATNQKLKFLCRVYLGWKYFLMIGSALCYKIAKIENFDWSLA